MRYAFLLLFAICATTISAQQTTDEQKKEINRIKKSADYLYGEATLATEEEAKDLAVELLYKNINEYCKKGDTVGVRGRLQVSYYEKDDVKRKVVDVIVERMTFLVSSRENLEEKKKNSKSKKE